MRIDELTITNFKCFENETFRFNPHFNVVIGKNGSGKSSLLDALSIIASTYISGVFGSSPKLIGGNEIRTALIDGQPKPQVPVKIKSDLELHGKSATALVEVKRLITDNRNKLNLTHNTDIRELENIANQDLQQSRNEGNKTTFPLIAYYGTGRLWGWGNEQSKNVVYFKQGEGVSHAYDGWENSRVINKGFLSFLSFLSWYKTTEDEVNKFKQPLDELFLKIVRDTISSMVPEWTDMAYSFRDEDLIGIFKDETGRIDKLPFSNLSDGYRNIIGMVADMVYRCIQLNPGLKENAVSDTDGIVLIDELDLHLHPEWQKRVAADLKRIFPKVQFIVTTHSPFIIQETEEGELIKMNAGEIVTTGGANEYSLEDVAEYIQDVKDPAWSLKKLEMYNAAKKYFELLNELQPGKGNGELSSIREELNILGKPYSDNVAYTAFLEQKRFLAEQNLGK